MDQQRFASADLAKLGDTLSSGLASGDGARSAHYAEIAGSLRADAARLRTPAIEEARALGDRLANMLLDQIVLKSVRTVLTFLRYGLFAGLFFFGVSAALQFREAGVATLSAYGVFYFAAALAAAMALSIAHAAGAKGARTRIGLIESELVELVRGTTAAFHGRLVDLRRAMEAPGANGMAAAVAAASDARLETVAALHFFNEAPIVGAEREGYTCEVLAGALRRAAADRIGRLSAMVAVGAAGLGAAGGGAAALYFSADPRPSFPPPPEFLTRLMALEGAAPGILTIAGGLFAAIILALISGRYIGLAAAGARPRQALEGEPARSIAAELFARTQSAAAERPRELVERYADALFGFEQRVSEWAGAGPRRAATAPSTFGIDPREEEPAWRRPPEGPRFVESRFAATPQQWLASPSGSREPGPLPSAKEGPTAPKRPLFSRPGRREA